VVRELQSIESELGLAQTPIEVAMDDWALATVADLEDRTKVRGVAGAVTGGGKRRRRRSVQESSFASVGTIQKRSDGGASTLSRIAAQPKGIKFLALGMAVIAVLVLALGITATFVIIRSGETGIPTVSGIQSTQGQNAIEFSWGDPGIAPEDTYQVTMTDGRTTVQESNSFVFDAEPGERVCITVSVNRSGTTGPPSSQKCVVYSE
jgi:hypothetical protein